MSTEAERAAQDYANNQQATVPQPPVWDVDESAPDTVIDRQQ